MELLGLQGIWKVLLLFFSFQSFLLGMFFLLKEWHRFYANRVFAILLFLFGYGIFLVAVHWSSEQNLVFTSIGFLFKVVLVLYGPIFYFYVRNLTMGNKIVLKDFYHAIPIVLVFYYLGSSVFPSLGRKEQIAPGLNTIEGFYIALSSIVYGIVVQVKYARKYKDLKQRVWQKAISAMLILLGLSFVLYFISAHFVSISKKYNYAFPLIMVLFIGLASYFRVHQPEIFYDEPDSDTSPYIKYKTSGLPLQFAIELKLQLKELMFSKKPYLDPDLHLDDLASLMNITRHHASQLINQHFEQSFYDFINLYRIEEAKTLLKDESTDLNIERVAFRCGFNNRISFYRAFKKFEGISPTEFKNRHIDP